MLQLGKVFFVGAGSGHPDYLTVKALRLLQTAEVVAYDDLVHPALLDLVPPDAELLPTGYRAFKRRPDLHPLAHEVLERAYQGKSVIRLKSGDPLVFGRTLEEIEALEQHGIPYEIVPGISAAFGAAASFGIPLTHRGVASGIRISAGNHAAQENATKETLVVYMPRKKLAELCLTLQSEQGYASDTPACYIQCASTPLERMHKGTIQDLPERVASLNENLPGLVIIGDVVNFARNRKPSEVKPWYGKRLAIARSCPGDIQLGRELQGDGADVIYLPYLRYSVREKQGNGLPAIIHQALKISAPPPDLLLIPDLPSAREFLRHDYGFDVRAVPCLCLNETARSLLMEVGFEELSVCPSRDPGILLTMIARALHGTYASKREEEGARL